MCNKCKVLDRRIEQLGLGTTLAFQPCSETSTTLGVCSKIKMAQGHPCAGVVPLPLGDLPADLIPAPVPRGTTDLPAAKYRA